MGKDTPCAAASGLKGFDGERRRRGEVVYLCWVWDYAMLCHVIATLLGWEEALQCQGHWFVGLGYCSFLPARNEYFVRGGLLLLVVVAIYFQFSF